MSILHPNKFAICIREYHPPLTWVPDTSPRQDDPRNTPDGGLGKGDPIRLYPSMVDYIKRHNSSKSWNWILEPGGAWNNSHPGPGEDRRAEQIGFGGNFVRLLEIKTGHARIEAWPNTIVPPEASNWFDNPTWWMKGSAVNKDLQVINPTNNIDAYIPSLKTDAAVWMPTVMLEMFPAIPPITGLLVNNKKGWHTVIFDYKLKGASVLGLTPLGWTYLLKSTVRGERVFPFDWHLNTQGVIPPPLLSMNDYA